MSELIAEARVLVTPDVTAFRTALVSQLAVATRGVTVPVSVTPTVATAGVAAVTAQQVAGARAAQASATQQQVDAAARRANTKAAADQARQLAQLQRGAASSALALTGLRGATLAATGPFLAGAAAFAVFAKSVGTSANLETSLNTFRVTADATADDMERISEVARELGTDLTLPGVTATRAADALAQLSRAGLSVEDSVDGVRGTLQLATAAAIDNEQAVLLTASALNAFSLEGKDAGRVADLLAASSKESQGSLVDVGLALQQSAAAAAQAGVSVEDTIALLTQLGRAGLRGSDAGTSLRVALLRLINPSDQARKAIEGLGIQIRDMDGNVRPEVFAEFTTQLQKLTREQADATLAMIFGQDAFRAAAILGREGATGLNEMREATQEVGAASELASARTEGLAGAFENLKNQGEDLGLKIGDAAKGPLTDFVNILAGGVQNINRFASFLDTLGDSTEEAGTKIEQANKQFQDLVQEAGRINFAAAVRGADAGDRLLEKQKELNEELKATQPAALQARGSIEDMGAAMRATADQAEGLRNRIDEAFDRFATTLPTPTVALPQAGASALSALDLALAQARGDQQKELQILRVQEQRQDAFLESVLGRSQTPKNVALARKAAANLDQTRSAIDAILTGQAAASRAAADKIAAQASAADASVIGALADARVRQENVISQAAQTEGTADDIRETVQLRVLIQKQIATIRAQVGDEKTKQAAITALTSAKIATIAALKRLRQIAAEEREANRQAIFDRTTENAALRTQIAEARGNEDAVILFVDQQIADAQKALARAKKAGQGILQATLAVEELKRKKRELLQQTKDAAGEDGGGTTAFDLLTQAAERFGASAGNLIGANQPFAGPTEFTADLSQFLRRSNTTTAVVAAKQSPFAGFQGSADRLVEAINRNTAALNGGEEGPTVRKGKRPPVSGAIQRNDQRWVNTAQARETVEGAGG